MAQNPDPGGKSVNVTSSADTSPGDEAAPGTPGTGEDICPECDGSGRRDGTKCANCDGTGRIVRAIGGA
jgi:DnaJ-class molecular chaperone